MLCCADLSVMLCPPQCPGYIQAGSETGLPANVSHFQSLLASHASVLAAGGDALRWLVGIKPDQLVLGGCCAVTCCDVL